MAKRRNAPLIDSDSSSGSGSDLESELLSLSKKRKTNNNTANSAANKNIKSFSDSDSDWAGGKNNATAGRKKKMTKKVNRSSSSESDNSENNDENDEDDLKDDDEEQPPAKKSSPLPSEINSDEKLVNDTSTKLKKLSDDEPEEGEVSDSDDDSDSSSSSSDSEFDDGFDENLMGDDEDRARLNALSEKERETEIFKRIERRDVMRTRWEIERKLKLARRGEKAKDKTRKDKKKKKDKKNKEKKPVKMLSPEPAPIKIIQKEKSPIPQPPVSTIASAPAVVETAEIPVETQSSPEKKDGDPGATNEYFDPKERSKERKKNVEANKTDDKRSNAMAMLKAKREGKAKREEEEAKRIAEREREEEKEELDGVKSAKQADKIKVSDIYSDDSGSSSSDDEEEEEKRTTTSKPSVESSSKSSSESEDDDKAEKKTAYIKTRAELNKLRISRYKMEKFLNMPIFEKTIMHSFVRISIGNNNAKPVYRAAEIVGIVETGKVYHLGKMRTNRGLRLKHGTQERVFRLEFISNQDFTESEFEKWREVCEKSNVPLPTLDMLEAKQKDIKLALNYEFSDEDVHKIIEERNRFRKNPTNFAMKKTCLMKERDAALLRGDNEIAHDLSREIDELESRASELDKRRSTSISLISYINNRNRRQNVEHAEKAIREEALANKGLRIEDPFTRRLTQPRMSSASQGNSEKKEETVLPALLPPPPPGRKKLDEDKKQNGSEHNLYSLHDFEIDLDVPLPVNPVNVMPKPVSKPAEVAPKRSLNLEDYKKKRGLI